MVNCPGIMECLARVCSPVKIPEMEVDPPKTNGWNPKRLLVSTLPEINIAPENRPSQKETSIPTIHFQGLC